VSSMCSDVVSVMVFAMNTIIVYKWLLQSTSGGFRHVTFRGCEEIVMYSATSLQFLDRVWTPFRVKDQDFDRLAVIRNLCGAVCIPATR